MAMSTWSCMLGGRILVQLLCGNVGGSDRVEEVRRGIVLIWALGLQRNGSKKKKKELKRAKGLGHGCSGRGPLLVLWFTESALPFKINNSGYSPRRRLLFPHTYNGPCDSQGRLFAPCL